MSRDEAHGYRLRVVPVIPLLIIKDGSCGYQPSTVPVSVVFHGKQRDITMYINESITQEGAIVYETPSVESTRRKRIAPPTRWALTREDKIYY